MGNRSKTKSVIALALLLGICIPLILGAIGDFEVVGDVKLTTIGKGVLLTDTEGEVWIYPCTNPATGDAGIKIPVLGYGANAFLSTYEGGGGELIFINTAAYEGDIQSVWSDTGGDVGAMTAASGDTLDATSADSTVPWRVNTTAAPTAEGAAIWDSDDDYLAVGDGTATLTMISTRALPPTSASGTGVLGQMAFDTKYAYRAVATNTWTRVALATWTDEAILLETGHKLLLETGDFALLE